MALAIRVSVGVLTYRRPDEVSVVLPLLVEQAAAITSAGRYAVEVLIIDNDPAASAASAVAPFVESQVFVRYVVEATPGISAARNRALDESAECRLLAFIDDDERPSPDWLAQLLDTWADTGAAGVAGRVLEEFTTTPDPWILAGEFFRRFSRPTGTSVPVGGAGNLLLDLDQVRASGVRFDPEFGLRGGEDTLFCRQLTRAGAQIVWCEEACAVDRIPAERNTRRWVLLRAFSHGNTAALVELALAGAIGAQMVARGRAATGGLLRIVLGTARLLVGWPLGSLRHQARGLRTAAWGAGMVLAASGWAHVEYRRTPGQVDTRTART